MNNPRIDIRKEQHLGMAGERPLLGDLYLPEINASPSRPAIVLIFGGGWCSSDRSQQKVYGLNLAKAGFVCLATDYRFSTEAIWPAQIHDVLTAVRWLRKNASEFAIDPNRIGVSGNSSGGHLALMAGTVTHQPNLVPATSDWTEFSNEVSAICAFYPPVRLAGLDQQSEGDTVATLMGADASVDDYHRASPIFYADQPFPPVLLMSGSDDKRVPVEHSYELQRVLEAAGNQIDLHVFGGQGHAFDAQLGFAQLCSTIMVDFFKRTIGSSRPSVTPSSP
jgi:acetyl esterase/lipase